MRSGNVNGLSWIVNGNLFKKDTKNTGSGEFQVEYYATSNIFKSNIVYATSQGLFIHNYATSEPTPVDVVSESHSTSNTQAFDRDDTCATNPCQLRGTWNCLRYSNKTSSGGFL